MPPRSSSSLTTPFPAADPENEVVCPLVNQDGSSCRKRCFGEKRYRSMQEHIRRAHPEHYIPKLPATAESFTQMITSEPHEVIPTQPQQPGPQQPSSSQSFDPAIQDKMFEWLTGRGQDHDASSYGTTAMLAPPNHFRRGSLLQSENAAAALAQLHNSRPGPDWQAQQQGHQDAFGESETDHEYMTNYFAHDGTHDMFAEGQPGLDMSQMQHPSFSPRSSSLQPQPFPRRPARPRKASVTENARKGKHERDKSKDLKRLSGHDRKALSAEPGHKRWEDLLDAAQSATEEESRDLTPIPQSPRASMPPYQSQAQNHFHSFTASPLQNTLLPHDSTEDSASSFNPPGLEPFPSVESSYDPNHSNQAYHSHQSSADSAHSNLYSAYARNHASSTGSNFHMPPEGLSSSSPHHASNASFARPQSSSVTHFPHPLHAAHLAQQQAAVAAAATVQGHRPHNPYSVHHSSFSAASTLSNNAHHGHLQDPSPVVVQHFCAACQRLTTLSSSYACQECVCGVCRDCFDVLMSMDSNSGPGCPRCRATGGRFKPFDLDLK